LAHYSLAGWLALAYRIRIKLDLRTALRVSSGRRT
jgi:hypothetical protein